ncbi:MAG: hypothetical protein IIX87_05280, partial [Firmicutes bacterium]|nr:hypothetical protein [Bacillota bacterium]
MIETERMYLLDAQETDIDEIIALESHPENRGFLWIGTYEEHKAEIADPDHMLLVFSEKETGGTVGYALIRLNRKSEI